MMRFWLISTLSIQYFHQITPLLGYLWLASEAFAGVKLRFVLPLDSVADVAILEVPGGQLPLSRRRHLDPSRGWSRRGSQVFLETGVAQLGHERLLPAAGGPPRLHRCVRVRVRRRRRSGCSSPFAKSLAAHGRHHLLRAHRTHVPGACMFQLAADVTFPGVFPLLRPQPSSSHPATGAQQSPVPWRSN